VYLRMVGSHQAEFDGLGVWGESNGFLDFRAGLVDQNIFARVMHGLVDLRAGLKKLES